MIQYDRDMSIDDIVQYWAGGLVLHRSSDTSAWCLAAVVRFSDTGCLGLRMFPNGDSDGLRDGEALIPISRMDFFDKVILHRPVVNLVEYDGAIFRVSWAPPDRAANRALSENAIRVRRLGPLQKFSPQVCETLIEFQKGWKRTRFDQHIGRYPKQGLGEMAGLTLLLEHVNRPPIGSIDAIFRRVLKCPDSVALISDDEWVHYTAQGSLLLYAGETLLCELEATAFRGWGVIGGIETVAKMWRPTVERHLTRSNHHGSTTA